VFLKARTPLELSSLFNSALSSICAREKPQKAPFACTPWSVSGKTLQALGFSARGGNLNKAHAGAKEIQISLLRRESESPGVYDLQGNGLSAVIIFWCERARAPQHTAHKHSKERWRKQSNFSHSPPNPRAAVDGLLLWMYACTREKPQIKSFSHTGPLSSLGKLRKTSQSGGNLHTGLLRASFVL
jgi:hypothetical protein